MVSLPRLCKMLPNCKSLQCLQLVLFCRQENVKCIQFVWDTWDARVFWNEGSTWTLFLALFHLTCSMSEFAVRKWGKKTKQNTKKTSHVVQYESLKRTGRRSFYIFFFWGLLHLHIARRLLPLSTVLFRFSATASFVQQRWGQFTEQFCVREREANLNGSLLSFFKLSETNTRVYKRQMLVPRTASCLKCRGSGPELNALLRFRTATNGSLQRILWLCNCTGSGLNL